MTLVEQRVELQNDIATLAGREVEKTVDTPVIKPKKTYWLGEIIAFLIFKSV